jgi:RNA polymerase sigma factor (sigma-70 family)
MKIGLQKRFYNAEIRNRRRLRGLTQKELGRAIGVSVGMVSGAENLRRGSDHPAASVVVKLAAFFNVSPDVLCPAWLRVVTQAVPLVQDAQREVSRQALEGYVERLTFERPEPQDPGETAELRDLALSVVATLKPRHGEIIKLFYGLGGEKPRSKTEIARMLGISKNEISRQYKDALRTLQHPERTRRLESYMEKARA